MSAGCSTSWIGAATSSASPCAADVQVQAGPLLGLTSGYVQRGVDQFPKQGTKAPWLMRQNYVRDLLTMRYGAIDDGSMVFSKGGEPVAVPRPHTVEALSVEAQFVEGPAAASST